MGNWWLTKVRNCLRSLVKYTTVFSAVCLGVMALIAVINVIGRFFFKSPLFGVVELVEQSMILIVMFAISYTAVNHRHVTVNVLTSRFPKRMRLIVCSIGFFFSAGIVATIAYQSILNAIHYTNNLELTTFLLLIPHAPFRIIVALGFVLLSIILLLDVFNQVLSEDEEEKAV